MLEFAASRLRQQYYILLVTIVMKKEFYHIRTPFWQKTVNNNRHLQIADERYNSNA